MKVWRNKHLTAATLASFALCMVTVAANSRCIYCFHQPKMPADVTKFRKF